MTTTDSNPQTSERPTAYRSPGRRQVSDDTEAHLLRLCLDLQLDALLLTLGAAAVDRNGSARDAPDPDGRHGSDRIPPPWRRWIAEDVDLATALAADALAGRATLPSTLGSEHEHRVPRAVLDDLTARYESMRDLLVDLLDQERAPQAAADEAGHWLQRTREALYRCRTRLVELEGYRVLQGYRVEWTPPSDPTVPPRSAPVGRERRYLPGELLG